MITKPLFLLPRTESRREAFSSYLAGESIPECYLFYGYSYFKRHSNDIFSNLEGRGSYFPLLSRLGTTFNTLISRLGAYGGDFDQALWGYHLHKYADSVFVYTGRLAFPLIWARFFRLLPPRPTLLLTNGLPERLDHFTNPQFLKFTLTQLRKLHSIVSMSAPELSILQDKYQLRNSCFIPEAVDVGYFRPGHFGRDLESFDVISIGADRYRDFPTVIRVAEKLPKVKFLIVTNPYHAARLGPIHYANITIMIDVPFYRLRNYIAASKISYVPVVDNIYSGGTTVVLQTMAMGLPTITNEVGSNVDPSFFASGKNIIFTDISDSESVTSWIQRLLTNQTIYNTLSLNGIMDCRKKRNLESFHQSLFEQFKKNSYQ